jgi:hypothetical protein
LQRFGREKKAVNFDQIELSGYSGGAVVVESSPVNQATPEQRRRATQSMRNEIKEENF